MVLGDFFLHQACQQLEGQSGMYVDTTYNSNKFFAEEFADFMTLLQKYAKYFLEIFLGMDQVYVRSWSKSGAYITKKKKLFLL